MKPPIEFRRRPKGAKAPKNKYMTVSPKVVVADDSMSMFIIIRRDRAKYNAYMRAYRKRRKEKASDTGAR